jgi:hypothetical protein
MFVFASGCRRARYKESSTGNAEHKTNTDETVDYANLLTPWSRVLLEKLTSRLRKREKEILANDFVEQGVKS